MQTEIKVYAPVIIPTLNRDVHFKRCLESLERCTGADKTTVYVALDYPPSEKYAEGWKKIDDYLKVKEVSNGFGELIVIRRDHNYGVCHENGNYETLIREIKKQYDRYILTEDDNEFSPCSLEYFNKNLERYKDDPSIFKVCAYLSLKDELQPNNYTQFRAKRHVAWGVGQWRKKMDEYYDITNRDHIIMLTRDKRVQEYFEKNKYEGILVSLVKMSKGAPILDDVIVAAYLVYRNMRCILPTQSMVRNHGWDGSGQHGGYVAGYKEQKICLNAKYVMMEAPESFTSQFEADMYKNRRFHKRNLNELSTAITWYLYKFTGIMCEFKLLHDICKYIKNRVNDSK